MKPRKWTHGTIGSVSTATMRTQDLMPAFVAELRWLGHRSKELTRIENQVNRVNTDTYYESEESGWDLEALFNMLDEHALPYMYFGAHPGDGADYGFWLSEILLDNPEDFDGMIVYDLNDIPVNYTGEVLEVNDHGNMTLYKCSRGKLREIWAIV